MLRRIIVGLAFAIALFAGHHARAAIAEDTASAAAVNASSGTLGIALTTAGANEILVVMVSAESNSTSVAPPTVNSISDNSGTTGTWTKILHGAAVNDGTITIGQSAEVWIAAAPSQITAKTITVTLSTTYDEASATVIAYTGQGASLSNYEATNTSLTELASGGNFAVNATSLSLSAATVWFGTSAANNGPPTNMCGSSTNAHVYGGTNSNVGFLARATGDRATTTGFSAQQTGLCTTANGATPATATAVGGWFAVLMLCNPCAGPGGGSLFIRGCCTSFVPDPFIRQVAW
jgi:hypothetical protein